MNFEIPLASIVTWICATCPMCEAKNWFEQEADDVWFGLLGECVACRRLFWTSEEAQKWENEVSEGFGDEVILRGGLEKALLDDKCLTGDEPMAIRGRESPD